MGHGIQTFGEINRYSVGTDCMQHLSQKDRKSFEG